VAAASNGEEALAWLSDPQHEADVALVDLRMPGMGGLDVIPAIRELRPELAIVANSAGEEDTNRQAALDAGAHAYCVKGDADALIAELERVAG
jgi:DNA-binding NarL/FixJ family response regulator